MENKSVYILNIHGGLRNLLNTGGGGDYIMISENKEVCFSRAIDWLKFEIDHNYKTYRPPDILEQVKFFFHIEEEQMNGLTSLILSRKSFIMDKTFFHAFNRLSNRYMEITEKQMN